MRAAWLSWITCWFDPVRDLAWVLSPTRFALIVLLIMLGVMVGSDQIQDELVAVGLDAPTLYLIGIYAALCWWAFNTFYWSRFVLDFEFRPIPPETCTIVALQGRAARIRWLVEQVPRVIGSIAFAVAAIGFLAAGLRWHLVAVLVIGGVFSYFLMWRRRPLLNRVAAALEPRRPRLAAYLTIPATPEQRFHTWRDIPANTWVFLAINAAISIALLLGTIFVPVVTARQFGTINVMLLGTTSWVVAGSVLVLFGEWSRVPVLALIAGYLLMISPLNNNHDVRRLDMPAAERPGLDAAFARWNAASRARPELGGSPARTPVIVVATEGGGVRAAYWTAILLAQLQEESPNFRDRLFAISGVSGGSLGTAVFDQLLGLDPAGSIARRPAASRTSRRRPKRGRSRRRWSNAPATC